MIGSRPSSDGGIFVSGRRSERRVIRHIYEKVPYFILILGTVSKATFAKLLSDGMERIIMGFSERLDTTLN